MTKKFYCLILLIFLLPFCGCGKEIKKEPQTLIYDTKSPLTMFGSISLDKQIKTTDAATLYKLQKLPLAGVFPVRNFLEKQVALSFEPKSSQDPDSVQTNANPNNNNSPVVIDASGFFTTFAAPPKKVAVLFSSYAQIWQDAGGTVSITVSESIDRGLVSKSSVSIVGSGTGKVIDMERLLSLEPDLVILTNDYSEHVELAELLRDNKIKTLLFQVDSFLDYLSVLKSCTTILNTPEKYETFGTKILDTVEQVIEKTSHAKNLPKVLFLEASPQGIKVKPNNHFVCGMLQEMKAVNIVPESFMKSDTLSPEIILTSNVDQILISFTGGSLDETKQLVEQEFLKNPLYQDLKAIKERRYYFLPKELFSYPPNKDWGKAYEYLANLLYPKEPQ